MREALDELLATAARLDHMLERRGWGFCFIGGVAVQRWGEPRFTQDIDLTLLTGWGNEGPFVTAILAELEGRIADAAEFASVNRVLLAKTQNGIDVDIALGALPFEQRSVERASRWQVRADVSLKTCSAEDLLIHKVFAGRPQDWADVERILTRQHGRLDFALVRSELRPLLELKGETAAEATFESLVVRVDKRLRSGA